MTAENVARNPFFLKNLTFYEPDLMVEFFGPKTKADPPDSQQ